MLLLESFMITGDPPSYFCLTDENTGLDEVFSKPCSIRQQHDRKLMLIGQSSMKDMAEWVCGDISRSTTHYNIT